MGQEIRISYTGDGFLYHMVRILTGTLVEVGLGLRKPEDEKLLLCIPSDAKHPEEGKKFIEYISE